MQDTIFSQVSNMKPLQDVRVSLIGKTDMALSKLRMLLFEAGAEKSKKTNEVFLTVTKSASLLIVGNNPSEDEINRVLLNKHDGFFPLEISERELISFLKGELELSFERKITKHINIDSSYYNWTPPIINDKEFASRVTSPVAYDMAGSTNCISQKEIYVPNIPGVNMQLFRQIIGYFGGYANAVYYDDTNIVLLSDDTLRKLEQGIKDDVILSIESKYNNSDSKMFNVQFTSESDFLAWVKSRLERQPDPVTQLLFDKLYI